MPNHYFISLSTRYRTVLMAILASVSLSACSTDELTNMVMGEYTLEPKRTALPPARTLEEILDLPPIKTALQRYQTTGGHKAIAISEDGLWGISGQTNSLDWAQWSAMRACNLKVQSLVMRSDTKETLYRPCFLYRLDNTTLPFPAPRLFRLSDVPARPTQYDLILNDQTQLAFETYQQRLGNKAFAISPAGEWAESYAYAMVDDAAQRAIRLCNNNMSLTGDDQCHLYAINDIVVTAMTPQ